MFGQATAGADRQRSAPARFGGLLAILLALPFAPLAAQPCLSDRIDERVRVSVVQDGDTVMLSDGRRLRLIGINTPELGNQERGPQAGAIAARDRLRQLVFSNQQQLQLRFDTERQDRYGRLLAHAFLADGRNITELLLDEGAGTQIVIPPNTWQARCYQQAARSARAGQRGLWALAEYRPVPVAQLSLRSEGFHIVRGRVSHLSHSASATWINLTDKLALRIERADLGQFEGFDLEALAGREIEVQGWLYARRGQLRLPLRHPAGLEIFTPQNRLE
ncbi:MAG: thermonuclease family protein [Gammaproteobacteria bacterium]